jgi:hypothetical protein
MAARAAGGGINEINTVASRREAVQAVCGLTSKKWLIDGLPLYLDNKKEKQASCVRLKRLARRNERLMVIIET